MPTAMLWFVLTVSLLAAAGVGVSTFGARRWRERTTTLIERLEATRRDNAAKTPVDKRYDARELVGLPPPVQRYFRAALKDGRPVVSSVDVELTGTFNLSATEEKWKPFTSRQRVVLRGRGFLWDAHIALLPGVPIRVHDAYIAGEGRLHAALLGLFPVADVQGAGEIARGELMRFLAEAAWYPTALLPSQGVRWESVDERSANGTLVDCAISVTLLVMFDDAGLIESVHAEARGATVRNEVVMVPWEGRWSDDRTRDGMTVPMAGEVAWLWPEGRRTYFRAAVTSLTYEDASTLPS